MSAAEEVVVGKGVAKAPKQKQMIVGKGVLEVPKQKQVRVNSSRIAINEAHASLQTEVDGNRDINDDSDISQPDPALFRGFSCKRKAPVVKMLSLSSRPALS